MSSPLIAILGILFIGLAVGDLPLHHQVEDRGDADHRGRESARRAARARPPARRPDVHDRAHHPGRESRTGARSAAIRSRPRSRTAPSGCYEAADRTNRPRQEELMTTAPHQILSRQAERQMGGRLRRDRRLYRASTSPSSGSASCSAPCSAAATCCSPISSSPGWRRRSRSSSTSRIRDEKKFWQGVRANPRRTARDVRSRFREIDRRLADVETYVTSSHGRLAREIEQLR